MKRKILNHTSELSYFFEKNKESKMYATTQEAGEHMHQTRKEYEDKKETIPDSETIEVHPIEFTDPDTNGDKLYKINFDKKINFPINRFEKWWMYPKPDEDNDDLIEIDN